MIELDDDTTDTAALDVIASSDAAARARAAVHQLTVNSAARRVMERQIAGDPYVTPEGRSLKVAQLRDTAPAQDAPALNTFETQVANIERLILPHAPVFVPPTAAHAAHVNGILSDLGDATPAVALRIAREAILRNDLALVARVADRLESFAETRAAFRDHADVPDVLASLRAALVTPEVRRSNAARTWATAARQELRYLQTVLADPAGDVSTHARMGALPTLFPQPVVESAS
jgi:hypothetical protein